jgi:hypothetical protein
MAASTLPEPGTKYGPCVSQRSKNGVVLNCAHKDCAESRMIARSVCRLCGRAIGYGERFYGDEQTREATGLNKRWVHAACFEDAVEAEQRARR